MYVFTFGGIHGCIDWARKDMNYAYLIISMCMPSQKQIYTDTHTHGHTYTHTNAHTRTDRQTHTHTHTHARMAYACRTAIVLRPTNVYGIKHKLYCLQLWDNCLRLWDYYSQEFSLLVVLQQYAILPPTHTHTHTHLRQ